MINLNDNLISELPQQMCSLVALRSLMLERNKLTRLPYGLHLLPRLEALGLFDNRLSDPPQVLSNPRGPPSRSLTIVAFTPRRALSRCLS